MKALLLFVLLTVPSQALLAQDSPSTDRASIEREVMAVLDAFLDGFNSRDVIAWESTYHFPHYRLASGGMSVLEAPNTPEYGEALFARLAATGWDHSAWDRREIVHLSDSKVHVDTQFIRYREDGSVLASFESLYILTLENGRWGVKMRSSFAP